MSNKKRTASTKASRKKQGWESWSSWKWLIPFIALLLYAQSLSNDFALDDDIIFTNNSLVEGGMANISAIVSNHSFEQENVSYSYRPVLVYSFAIQKSLFGYDPMMAHLVNILLYGLLCLLVFTFLRKLMPVEGKRIALLASILFLLHPIHNEVVNNVKSRDELLVMIFGLSAFLVSIQWKKAWFPLGLLLFAGLGLLSAYTKMNGAVLIAFSPLIYLFVKKKIDAKFLSISFIAVWIIVLRTPIANLGMRVSIGLAYMIVIATLAILSRPTYDFNNSTKNSLSEGSNK
jgi:hypothetical protein